MEIQNKELLELEFNLWKSFDYLKETVEPKDYDVLLFLLTLHYNGILDKLPFNNLDLVGIKFEKAIQKHVGSNTSTILEVFPHYQNTLKVMSPIVLAKLIQLIFSLNSSVLFENFTEIFDDTIKKYTNFSVGQYSAFFLPEEIYRFITQAISFPNFPTIYNPFAGLASFGLLLKNKGEYLGQESNFQTWAIGKMRAIAYDYNNSGNFTYLLENSIQLWNPTDPGSQGWLNFGLPNEKLLFDVIISSPPLGLKLPTIVTNNVFGAKTAEMFFLQNGLETLSPRGKLIGIISNKILYGGGAEHAFRKKLVDNDQLEMIISFPSGLLYSTGMPFEIIVAAKDKSYKNKVTFVDASSFIVRNSTQSKVLDYTGLSLHISNAIPSDSFITVDNSLIIENEYNLNANRYLIPIEQNNAGTIELSKVAKIRQNERPALSGTRGKLIKIKDLKSDFLVPFINDDDLDTVDIPSGSNAISDTCLLLALRFGNLKPSLLNYLDESNIYASNDIAVLFFQEEKIDPNYLVYELNSDFVKTQLKKFIVGATIPTITKTDLLKVRIRFYDIETQKSIVNEQRRLAYLKQHEELQKYRQQLQLSDEGFIESASLKHSVAQHLLKFSSGLTNIQNSLQKLNPNWRTVKLSERFNTTIQDTVMSMFSSLDTIHSLFAINETEFNVNHYKLTEVDIIEILGKYVENIRHEQKNNVTVSLEIHPDITNFSDFEMGESINNSTEQRKLIILGNENLLKIAFDNIVDNAKRHGFINEDEQYNLGFQLSLKNIDGVFEIPGTPVESLSTVKLEIFNDGEPFPMGLTVEKLIRRGSHAGRTGHTGIGGHDLNEIIKYHNNGISTLRIQVSEIFIKDRSSYILTFPIISII